MTKFNSANIPDSESLATNSHSARVLVVLVLLVLQYYTQTVIYSEPPHSECFRAEGGTGTNRKAEILR